METPRLCRTGSGAKGRREHKKRWEKTRKKEKEEGARNLLLF